jgi:hypothetical protein
MENIIDIIQKNSLTVRCLPYIVIGHYGYREGDEERCIKPIYDSKGNILNIKRTVVFNEKWNRKMLREKRIVENEGWWLVKETQNTSSTVTFNRKTDFFAPTLEEAIALYLNSKKIT